MDNSTTAGNNNVGNTGMDSATLAGVISTAISFAALIVSSIQLLYQYYTNVSLNALGARNCNERVMGPWARFTRRRWRWLELRFEIIFESPILFVAPAWNTRGPNPDRPIWYMNGSELSYEETRTPLLTDSGSSIRTTAIRRGVNVMEDESRKWQDGVQSTEKCQEPLPFERRSLAVAVQAQRLSWDFVPNFKKPFATSAMCHIVEIAAMLGIHWTMWDSTNDRYRAEGNGYMLLGSFNADQGIVFQLVRNDKTEFRENRLIPSNTIKQLCFGFAPTLYYIDRHDEILEKGEYKGPLEPILPLLKLGSRQEISDTLLDIGCSVQVAEYFLNEEARVSHLFPVVFDVLGMLGRSVSLDGYCYRMLPNPTVFRLDRRWFDTKKLLLVFKEHFSELHTNYAASGEVPEPLLEIATALDRLSPLLENPQVKNYSPGLLDTLRAIMKTLNSYIRDSPGSWESPAETTVLETVAHHVASIVADIGQRPSYFIDKFPLSRANDGTKERNLLSFLFERSRFAATRVYDTLDALRTTNDGFFHIINQIAPPINQIEERETPYSALYPWRDNARLRDVTWCLLVFRMLCWLQLHDFHRDDVMIPRSATFGSRMPVYMI
ncbi:hypothetical protein F4677DRAFT_464197 [Hypoxylon crocopeplum]|nr:hypothetical protein F4677DRAFT_464197 [Hypoxylon crocopeplum]